MFKILVFGYGSLWSNIKKNLDFSKCKIIGFVNSDIEECGKEYENIEIIHTSEIRKIDYDYMILASQYPEKLISYLTKEKLPTENVLIPYISQSNFIENLNQEIEKEVIKFSKLTVFSKISKYKTELPFISSMDFLGRDRTINLKDSHVDYVRLSTLELIADELNGKNVGGNIAELGVYKGEFAKHINKLFPNRKLYLFDTFEGFSIEDIKFDKLNNYSNQINSFKDTSIDLVLEKMPVPKNIEIKKGYFPDSLEGLEDSFAFVSIDTDLYKPIYSGLEYFYPRLVKGGYIMIHDYNNDIYSGVKEAVNKFAIENEITVIPLSDRMGSAIIIKQ